MQNDEMPQYLSDEALGHEHHLDQFRWMLTGNPANDDYFRAEAAEMHARVVIDGVQDLRARAIEEGSNWGGDLHAHLVYGVGRRAGDIWIAMRELVAICPVSRKAPLSSEQTARASMALNTIYINIRGILDNFAWAVIEQAGGLAAGNLSHSHVDLFGHRFSRVKAYGDLPHKLSAVAAWSVEVKERRNPAAHRIPLAVIPALLNEEQAAEARHLTAQMFAPLRSGGLTASDHEKLMEQHEALKAKIEGLGTYRPLFVHMPSEGTMPLYPTVAEDVGQMVRAGRVVLGHLGAKAQK